MQERTVLHSTFVIERTYAAPVERVFAAFSDPASKRRWYAEGEGRTVEEFKMDFRVGGSDLTRFRFERGLLTNHTTYQDIVPNRRIVFAYTMGFGEQPFSASLATLEFVPSEAGTDVIFTDQGAFFEGSDGPQIREQGWKGLLDSLQQHIAAGHATLAH